MGDTDVDFFQETLKQLITSSKVRSIMREKHQLESLEEKIKYMRVFLKVTEKKRNKHSEVMNLVRQIKDVVSEAENIIELFVVQAFKAKLAPYFLRQHPDDISLDLESVKKNIKTLTAEIKQISDENMYDINVVASKKLEHFSLKSEGGSSSSGGRNTSKVAEEKVVVGFKEEVKTLIGKLLHSGEGGRLEIISIVGAGGGGKTILAREVYDHPRTLQTFGIRAWVNVSQEYDKTMKRDLLIRILESASPKKHGDYEKITEDKLREDTLKCLMGKKYLIVMDDIWDIEAWNDIQASLPQERLGSKVLFTSQLPVEPKSLRYVPHHLAPLTKSCSWELLQKKVFGKKSCPPELVGIGEHIVEKCKGLPLAIVAIAGILAVEDKTLDVWEEVSKHLCTIIAKSQDGCMEILELSYNHLPLHLKACFVYIGGFPEDSEILVRELIWLWIAEGFIQQSEGDKSLEDVAKDYLSNLIDRNLVMVSRNRSFGGIKACRIHDLLRELGLKKAKEDNFLLQIYGDDTLSPSAATKHRRLFIGSHFFHKFSLRPCTRNLHSFLFFSLQNSPYSWFELNLSFFVKNFELLRVLSFISAKCRGEIGRGHLVHLRYLALQLPNDASDFVSPFSYLFNLETLNLQAPSDDLDWKPILLPHDIFKMVKLRHLYAKRRVFKYHLHAGVGFDPSSKLDSLQTLHPICPCEECRNFLVRTPNVRTLGFFGDLRSNNFVLMLPNLEFLKCLETLSFVQRPIPNRTSTLRPVLKFPPTVTRLTLKGTRIMWEELSILQTSLPSLEVLKLLEWACQGPIWNTSELEEGFSQLKYLRLQDLDIEDWNASEDQFPRLEVLVVKFCKKLKRIPIEFANLNELREIEIRRSGHSVEESAREIQKEQRNLNHLATNIVFDESDNENMRDIKGLDGKKLEHSSSTTEDIGGSSSSRGSNTYKVAEENVVVGFKEEVKTLLGKLQDSGEGGRLEIISIIGPPGGGKTTLAREVYDHPLTSHTFEFRAWVNVSQDYDKTKKRNLLIRILELASPKNHGDYKKSSEDKLGEDTHKCLKGKKYLIVMDDIWGTQAWNDIQRSLPNECKGSKVLFTSRQPVEPNSIHCVPHYLAPLPDSYSWELLQKKSVEAYAKNSGDLGSKPSRSKKEGEVSDVALQFLLDNLQQLVVYNAKLFIDVKDEVKGLIEDLEMLKAFIEDSAEKSREYTAVQVLVTKIRALTFEAEDAIDVFVMEASIPKSQKWLRKVFHGISHASKIRDVAVKVQTIRANVKEIYDNKLYGYEALQGRDPAGRRRMERRLPSVEKDNVVGFDEATTQLIGWLTGGAEDLQVFSIIGMAGLGKTTLANKIYYNPRVSDAFSSLAWIYVSQTYTCKDLFLTILKSVNQVTSNMFKMNEDMLAEEVSRILTWKYLIVVDDVWGKEDWDRIKRAFPNCKNGSRILLTSRNKPVAVHANPRWPVYELDFLNHDQSFELLQNRVFGGECPQECQDLIPVGKEIAEQCNGLPLALEVIAGMLQNDISTGWWETVSKSVNAFLVRNEKELMEVLALSYYYLPPHLKACFLYFGVFPENYEIPVWILFRLLVAEGFVQKIENVCLEEMAKEHLEDLVSRSLVMVEQRSFNGRIKTCRIHGMLRDLCLKKATEENFLLEIRGPGGTSTHGTSAVSIVNRRICIHSGVLNYISSKPSAPYVRSFLCFAKDQVLLSREHVGYIPEEFKLLRVFHIQPLSSPRFPSEILQLVHLTYVALSGDFKSIPSDVSKLWNLQTLIVETTSRTIDVKADIWKMTQFRHLHTNAASQFPGLVAKKSESIQTLSTIAPESCTEGVLGQTPCIKKLGIRGKLATLLEEKQGPLFDNLTKLQQLVTLKLVNDVFPRPPAESKLQSLPQCNEFPPNLKRLTLADTFLDWKHMFVLGMLPELEELKLKDNAFVGVRWSVVDGGFKKLKALQIWKTDLAYWEAKAEHFPSLQHIVLKDCTKLQAIPSSLGNLETLRTLKLHQTSYAAATSARDIKEQQQESNVNNGLKVDIFPSDL